MLCLNGLQAIFQNEAADFPALTSALASALVAVEQVLVAKPNEICEDMLVQAKAVLDKQLSPAEIEAQIDSATKSADNALDSINDSIKKAKIEVKAEDLTLDEAAALLMLISPQDTNQLSQLRDSLKSLSGKSPMPLVKKLLTKAARETDKILTGKADNPDEVLTFVGELIDQSSTELANFELNNEMAASEKGAIAKEVKAEQPKAVIKPTAKQPVAEAHPQVVNLQPDELQADADTILLAEFITESNELIEAAEVALLALETDPDDLENVSAVFRAFHTVKGSAAFLGLKRLTELAHLAESLLSRIRDREIRCTGGYADLALRSADAIKEMLASVQTALEGGAMILPATYGELISVLAAPEAAGISGETNDVFVSPSNAQNSDNTSTQTAVKPVSENATAGQVKAAASTTSTASTNQQKTESATTETSVRVRTDRLDSLIDMVGELVIAQSMLAQDATTLDETHLELARKIMHSGKIVRELQDLSMAMRMVPLKATFQKMARVVRDVAQKCGKQVEFVTEGEDTEIDRNLVDVIADPLVHMVRNSVDHGVELPDVRELSGKSKTGKVRLAAYHAGGNVVVELADDGKGLDSEKLFEKAVSKGLVEPDKKMSESEIFNLIFAPGFSTAEQITDVSGRGVGMDVVRRNIEGMRGRIEIASVKGHGSTFTIRLPLTLAITDGMLVRIGNERFIVPTVNIHLSFRPTPSMISSVSGRGEMVLLRGELLPIYRLHRLFDVQNAVEDPTQGLLMIISDGRRRCALLGDELLGQQQVVAKTLGRGINKVQGVSGGAILADGRVGLILDTAEIVALARLSSTHNDRKENLWQNKDAWQSAA